MTAAAILVAAALLGQARSSVVELSCSDNATCIENMAREFVRGVRTQKTMRVFDAMTIEPLKSRQARSFEGPIARFLQTHAFSFDWNEMTFKLGKAQERSNALEFEVFESRSAKDVSEDIPKKSKSKVEEDVSDDEDKKSPKGGIIKRRAKKKILQAVIPMVFGMKSTAAILFAFGLVTTLTLKAWAASKLALLLTVGMAAKKLYESYSLGVGLQNHPYLYSQYPIDFPSASSHAYSVSGVSPQFPPEMYNPTALGAHSQPELLHNDASAQQSQQAPTLQLINSTRASERWDGKSKLQKLLEPIVEGIKSYVDPIANMFSMQTFRGMSSDSVTTMKTIPDLVEEEKKPREYLRAQPRNIAQRKMTFRNNVRQRPKKYSGVNVDLDKLKNNKDFYDYVKAKKYKYNYQHTSYYPRIRYYVNPSTYFTRPTNVRLIPYRRDVVPNSTTHPNVTKTLRNTTIVNINEWKPVVLIPVNASSPQLNVTNISPKPFSLVDNKFLVQKHKRVKRSLTNSGEEGRGFFDWGQSDASVKDQVDPNNSTFSIGRSFFYFLQTLFDSDPITAIVKHANSYTESVITQAWKSKDPPGYYTIAYDLVLMSLDVMDGLFEVQQALSEHLSSDDVANAVKVKPDKKKKKKKQKKPHKPHQHHQAQVAASQAAAELELSPLAIETDAFSTGNDQTLTIPT